jgi:hypothetical protein
MQPMTKLAEGTIGKELIFKWAEYYFIEQKFGVTEEHYCKRDYYKYRTKEMSAKSVNVAPEGHFA